MLVAMRIVGGLLIVLALLNLLSLFILNPVELASPALTVGAFVLMIAAGIGFLMLRRWGVLLYILVVLISWSVYFLVYGGEGAAGPFWLSVPLPLAVLILSAFAWKRMRWY